MRHGWGALSAGAAGIAVGGWSTLVTSIAASVAVVAFLASIDGIVNDR